MGEEDKWYQVLDSNANWIDAILVPFYLLWALVTLAFRKAKKT